MAENFDVINAPQFFDFSKNSPDDVDDTFFDNYNELEMQKRICEDVKEDHVTVTESKEIFVKDNNNELEINIERCEDQKEDPLQVDDNTEIVLRAEEESYLEDHEDQRFFRRSMSMGDLFYLETALKSASLGNQCTNEKSNDGISENKQNNKLYIKNIAEHPQSASCENLKRSGAIHRTVSKEALNRLAQPKKKFGSDQTLNRNNCLTMAEAVQKFQQNTPERFRSKPKLDVNHRIKLGTTVPHSPHLISNKRNRPVSALSHEEQEKRDFEEAQKFKIKAHPINKKILQGPLKPTFSMEKKHTVPEPFKLTEVHHKVVESPRKYFHEFHANPVPNFNKPIVYKPTYQKQVTNPQTPNILKRYQRTLQQKPQPRVSKETQKQPIRATKPLPFSFEARNEVLRKKKEEFIQDVYRKEKQAREFHARPVPKAVLQPPKNKNGSYTKIPVKNNSSNPRTKSEENLSTEFKARPPTVLYKKPFEPKRDEKPLTEISEFQLNTDQRAREREYFEQQLKEKEERLALAKQLEEQMRVQKEQEEAIRLRKMTEYKAQPIKKYKEVIVQPSGKVTEPISPKFHYRKNSYKDQDTLEENKENSE